nr:ABC transporter B family member 21-like [Coffea arabica]
MADKVPFYKLFSFADPADYVLMVVGTVAATGAGICLFLTTGTLGEMLNSFGETLDRKQVVHEVSKVSSKYVYLALGFGVASFSQVACWTLTGQRQAVRIRSLYLQSLLTQEIAFFDKETSTGDIIERISVDTFTIQDAIGEKVGRFIQLSASVVGGFASAFNKGWLLSLVLLSSIPPLILTSSVTIIQPAKQASRGQAAYSVAATVVEQTLISIRTVASFTGEKQAIAKYGKSLNKAYNSGVQEGLAAGFGFGLFMFFYYCIYALAVWFGSKMIAEKQYSGGDVLNVTLSVLTGSFFVGQASPCLSAFASGQSVGFKIFQIMKRKPDISPSNSDGLKLDNMTGTIELKDIYFSYPARLHEQIFSGFSLFIRSGTTTALVGQSGQEKSTVLSLIERFYDPQAGEVLIDDINIKEFQLKWIRSKIGLVSQEPVLFAQSIRDNIAYGKDNASLEEIQAAAEHANAAKFIDKLPQGLDTMVGSHGIQMSGGQKQRIAIARAILKDPRILLLDEATSAPDAESERTLQEALDGVMVNRTTVIVAHRLSTVKNADEIAVIDQGKIVEKGSHIELLQDPEGAYSQLIRQQQLNKGPDDGVVDNHDKSEIKVDSGRHLNQRISFLESTSQCSSVVGSSSRHSFSISIDMPETAVGESKKSVSLPLKMEQQVPLYRLAYLNKPEIPELLLGSMAAVITGSMLPILGVILSRGIKTFYDPAHELHKNSRFWALMLVVLGVASLLATPLKAYYFAVAGCKLIKRIRLKCFEKIVHMDISWFDREENSSGRISSQLSIDATSVGSLVGESLSMLVQNSATGFAGLLIGFAASWRLSLIVISMLPLIGFNGYMYSKALSGYSANAKKLYEEATQVAIDAVGSIRTVASFSAEDKVISLYEKKCNGPATTGIKRGLYGAVGYGLSMFLLYSIYATIFYAGAQFVEAGKITFSDVFQVFYGLTMAAIAISQSSKLSPDSSKARSGAASIFALLDLNSPIDSSKTSGITLDNVKGEILFQHVSFKYPNRPDVQILKDLCLAIESCQTLALVGDSGSGKSSVISLLQRFYDPDSGEITLDGMELRTLNLKWLRQQMGLVSQEPVLFNGTIRANIAYGKEGSAAEAEIISAAEKANAHNFISSLQQGYDTIIGERGKQLSGGQKQRVAIARAIIKSPKILLLDDATSSLDAESENVAQDALVQAMEGKTTILVTHRLSTIKGADLIAVVKNGVIQEKGNHESLISIADGIYASLVEQYACAPST